MAESMRSVAVKKKALICPMIDARRDEVFTALYSLSPKPKAESRKPKTVNGQRSTVNNLKEILPPQALILDKNAFEMSLAKNTIIFFGTGAEKWKKITESSSAIFKAQPSTIQAFATLAQQDFSLNNWADPIYSEPIYLKEFFTY
jgi:tRNA threonylcarbamoyladenosine biosynthesis protein TsaB